MNWYKISKQLEFSFGITRRQDGQYVVYEKKINNTNILHVKILPFPNKGAKLIVAIADPQYKTKALAREVLSIIIENHDYLLSQYDMELSTEDLLEYL